MVVNRRLDLINLRHCLGLEEQQPSRSPEGILRILSGKLLVFGKHTVVSGRDAYLSCADALD